MPLLINEPGHGSNTWPPSKGVAAKVGVPGMAEHDFNAAVAAETARLLEGKIPTYSAQPFNGPDVPLATRIANYNSKYRSNKDAIGMSHHGNAGNASTRGFGVFYWHTSAAGKKLAQMVLEEYKAEFPDLPIWGTGLFPCVPGTWTDFYLVRETAAPFVLIEWEFFTNVAARKLMLTSDYRKRCGKVASKAACRWYGIPFEVESTPVKVSKPVVIPAAASKTEMAEKLELTKRQREELAAIFKKAHESKVFSSDAHAKDILNGTMTASRLMYLQAVIVGAALNGGKRIE